MTPIIIWQIMISLLIFIISFPLMYGLSFLFRHKWIKKFFKIWIIFIFISFITKIVLISNPFQNSEIIYLVLFIFYIILFYGFNIYNFHNKELEIIKNKFKKSHKVVFFSIFILFLMIFGRVEPLFSGDSVLNDKQIYLNENNDIVKGNEFGEKFFAMYDIDNNGVYETIKYDINGDNIADIINIDKDENGEIDDIEILTYNKQGYIIIFIFLFFLILIYVYNHHINNKKGGKFLKNGEKNKQNKIAKDLVLDALKDKTKVNIIACLILVLIFNNIFGASIVHAYTMDQSTIEREFKACLEDPFNSIKCNGMNKESLKYIRLLYSYPDMRKDYERLGMLSESCQKGCSQEKMKKLSIDGINIWNKWKNKPIIYPNNSISDPSKSNSNNNTSNDNNNSSSNNNYKPKGFDSTNNKTDYNGINDSLTAISKSFGGLNTIFKNINDRIIPENINGTNIYDITKRLKDILKGVNTSSNYNGSDYKELLKNIYSSGNTKNVDDILDNIKGDYGKIVGVENLNNKLGNLVKGLDKLGKGIDILSNGVHFHEKLNGNNAKVITATTISTGAKWILEKNPVSGAISIVSTVTYFVGFEGTASDIDRINIGNVSKDLITDAYTTEEGNFMRISEYEMSEALKNWENPNLSNIQKVGKHFGTTINILYTGGAALTKTILENSVTNELSNAFNDGAKMISKNISKIF